MDLKLLEWVQSPLKACRDKALRCVTEASVAHQTAGKQGPHHGKDVLRLEQDNGGLTMRANGKLSPNRGHGHTLSLLTIFGIVIGETRQKQVF